MSPVVQVILRAALFAGGLLIVLQTIASTVRTFVLPRGAPDAITAMVFVNVRRVFELRLRWAKSFTDRDRMMALYAPICLFLLLPVWLTLLTVGYALMYWALGTQTFIEAIYVSGSSLLTLGFASADGPSNMLLEFTEATLGLMLVALLIAYLPTMYNSFSRREIAVTQLDVRAGSPPKALNFVLRNHRIDNLEHLKGFWSSWEQWFAELEESHTSLAPLVFFRSPQPDYSWITAAGAVLDSAALMASTVDVPREPQAELCIRAGYLALRRIADFFGIKYADAPHFPDQSISVQHSEFDEVYDELKADGVPLKPREQAWRDFSGWRVNYDEPLIALCALVMAPYAPWSSDRSHVGKLPPRLRFGRLDRQEE